MSLTVSLNHATKKIPSWPIYALGVFLVGWLCYEVGLVYVLVGKLPIDPHIVNWFYPPFIADPVKYMEFTLGEWSLKFLIVTLLITPIRDLTGVNLIKYRRALGLCAFFMAMAHLLVYLVLDNALDGGLIINDITRRPYIMFGVLAFVVMIPMAWTSRNAAIRKMGPIKWGKLHRLIYVAIIAAVLHFVLLKKTWETEPLVYCGIALVLLVYRDVQRRRKNKRRMAA